MKNGKRHTKKYVNSGAIRKIHMFKDHNCLYEIPLFFVSPIVQLGTVVNSFYTQVFSSLSLSENKSPLDLCCHFFLCLFSLNSFFMIFVWFLQCISLKRSELNVYFNPFKVKEKIIEMYRTTSSYRFLEKRKKKYFWWF